MNNLLSRRGSRGAGLTLLEVVFSSAIMSVLATAIFLILHRSSDHFGNESSHLQVESRARELVMELTRDLRESRRDSFSTGDPPTPVVDGQTYNDFRFGVNPGYNLTDRKAVYGQSVRYRFRLDDGEVADGLDNNNNGLVDEGTIEKTDRFGITTRVGKHVASPGLTFTPNGKVVQVGLTLQIRDLKGTLITRQASIAIDLRNEP